MDFNLYSIETIDCKNIGGFCNLTDFQNWYCEWKEMNVLRDLCPLPSMCCIPKAHKWCSTSSYVRSFVPATKTIFYYLLPFLLLIFIGFLAAKLAKRFFNQPNGKRKASTATLSTTSSTAGYKFPTALAMDEWAVKTLIKLLPTISKNQLKVGQKISEGAFLVLHKSTLRDSSSSVCLKSMKCPNENYDIFLNEAAICWRIRMCTHRFKTMPLHICRFNGICQLRPAQFGIVMEWMNLGSVHTFLNEQQRSTGIVKELQEKDLLRIAIQLHTLLIVHGNICARNCLLSGDPLKPQKLIAKLSDFGNAQMLSTKNDIYECWTSDRKYWPYKWMAPECLMIGEEHEEKHEFSIRSDIWSFGIFLVELFTLGADPYPHLDNAEVKSLLLQLVDPKVHDPMNISELLIPRDVKRIIRKCLAIAPKDRPKAEHLIKMLQQC